MILLNPSNILRGSSQFPVCAGRQMLAGITTKSPTTVRDR